MNNKREKRMGAWFVYMCVCLGCVLTITASAYAQEPKKVRVGVFNHGCYHITDDTGRHTGYDYEYLNKIAAYTGWEYEYVEGTWEECLSRLERGEIDLLGGVEKNSQRQKVMNFSEVPIMCVANCMLEAAENSHHIYEDFEGFDGMQIGTLAASTLTDMLEQYSKEKGFSYTLTLYDTEAEMEQALQRGDVDCICMSSSRDLSPYTILAYFGYSQYYYATSKKCPEMEAELDDALSRIWVQEPEFEHELYDKYFDYAQNIAFTKAEKDYIEKSGPIQVGLYMDIGKLLCRTNEDGQYVGLAIDALEELSRRTGLRFEYHEIPAGSTPGEYLKEHPDALVAPSLVNSLISHDSGYLHLAPVIKGRMLTVTKNGLLLECDDAFTMAVPAGLYMEADQIAQIFPNAVLISCSSHREGLELVKKGKADVALVNEITAAYQMQSPLFEKLQTVEMANITEDITLGLSYAAQPELISILNKGIFSFSERDVRRIVVQNTASTSYELTTKEWFYQKRFMLVQLFLLTTGILLLFYQRKKYLQQRREDKQRLLLTQERLNAERDYQEKLFKQAHFDGLTGLYNKEYFYEKTNEMLKQNPDTVFTFLWLNIKGFKMLNDLYGRDTGNAVLKDLADIMRSNVHGTYGRFYADKFAMCMAMDKSQLDKYMQEKSVYLFTHNGQKLRIQIHVGAYVDTQKCQNAVLALDYAQIALQNGDKTERSHIAYFENSYLKNMRIRQQITNEMERALLEEQFQVYLQPQFNIEENKLIGAEALVRWIHPQHGIVSPAYFIPVFENNGFICRLDLYMYEKVCSILAEWLKLEKVIPISINLSQMDLENEDLIPTLQRIRKKYRVPVRYLHLEITESAYAQDQQQAKHVIEELRNLGYCVEMDDFGRGYSSLNMLKDVPVDVLKMDMQFFEGETNMERGGHIIDTVVKMAHAMNIMVIAEGVETKREVKFLKDVGCSFVQGYFYGRPMALKDFEGCLADNQIGEKYIDFGKNDVNDLYWKVEKYEILLQNEQVILFDYDPHCDRAVFSYMFEGKEWREVVMHSFFDKIEDCQILHPDYREKMGEALWRKDRDKEELDFMGSFGDEQYEWFHAVVYYYMRNKVHSRTIAIIKQKDI